ncbi:MAG: alpha-amylase family glycosyl hydrolase [Gaiellaceae bacterium]
MWWRNAVVYQIYPRSFQDSDGDGVGDLRGIEQRLDHLVYLGVDAFWLSPIYPSPLADFGYDVSDYTGVDPAFGTLEDLDSLVRAAHARGLKVLLDLVPSHTSIEHPWFREHPDWYIWSPVDGPPNNWKAAFGGGAWSRDEQSERWYLHTFYPEQPDLDWRNPEVVAAMQEVVRFWRRRGVDGFRVDAVNVLVKDAELRDDPPAPGTFPFPLVGESAELEHVYSADRPEVVDALAAIREAAGDALLVGEVYLPATCSARYLEHLDLVFAFELLFSPWEAETLRAAIGPAAELGRVAWVLSNHDFERLATRVGPENVRAAALLLLTLPGAAFIYQGDEIGLPNGPGADPPYDRAGRDPLRHPMQWDASPTGGFTTGEPWLPPIDPAELNVEAQRGDPGSLLELYRKLIALRRELGDGFRLVDAEPGVVAFERGRHTVAVNTTAEPRRGPAGEPLLATHQGEGLPPHAAVIVRN